MVSTDIGDEDIELTLYDGHRARISLLLQINPELKGFVIAHTTANGAEVVRCFEELDPLPDAVVLDQYLAGHTGVELARLIRSVRRARCSCCAAPGSPTTSSPQHSTPGYSSASTSSRSDDYRTSSASCYGM